MNPSWQTAVHLLKAIGSLTPPGATVELLAYPEPPHLLVLSRFPWTVSIETTPGFRRCTPGGGASIDEETWETPDPDLLLVLEKARTGQESSKRVPDLCGVAAILARRMGGLSIERALAQAGEATLFLSVEVLPIGLGRVDARWDRGKTQWSLPGEPIRIETKTFLPAGLLSTLPPRREEA